MVVLLSASGKDHTNGENRLNESERKLELDAIRKRYKETSKEHEQLKEKFTEALIKAKDRSEWLEEYLQWLKIRPY